MLPFPRSLCAAPNQLSSSPIRSASSNKWFTCSRLARGPRLASTSSSTSRSGDNPYPFPQHRNPTPYQIFHLPTNATDEDIKTRYYDLVRIYHPDKAGSGVPLDVAHTRFQVITAAHDILRKKTHGSESPFPGWAQERSYPTTAAWRAASRVKRTQELYSGKKIDDRWKDRVFVLSIILTIGAFVFQTASTRREAMTDVFSRSQHAAANIHDRKKTPPVSDATPKQEIDRLTA